MSLNVIRKTWTPSQTTPEYLNHSFVDFRIAEKFFNKQLRKAKDNVNRIYYVELSLIEDDVIRDHRLLSPSKIINRKYSSVTLKR